MNNNTGKYNVGYTLFKPTGVHHEFPLVDLVKQQVIGTVSYKEKTYMTVVIDLKADTVQVQGDVDDLGDLSMDRDSYIDMFKQQAKFFMENNISNPKEYYDELINK
ncbi:hypothetical protein QUF86_27445 [Peribacillus sp. NJ11]|uniref:hypothetical protein n=1 Tax=Peribacillus sp. NJ11 TaxID=3055861 RepID=UPI0025A15CF5|nr:hypothetical protein [Peribacillus sp. NJ11]MDM5224394.1 hypothetical protein [Peribacillus sp. NJ11]